MKKYFVLMALICAVGAIAAPIAWVDQEPIAGQEYINELESLPDSLDIMEKRKLALDNIIEVKLLEQYAAEQDIEVTEEEVESLFMQSFSEHEMFTTDGEFDYAKYYSLKDTERIKFIRETMRRDILIEKTRELLKRQLSLNDEELLERYILENVSLDISYAVFDLDQVSVSRQLTAAGAWHYWRMHRDEYQAQPQYKIGFTFIPLENFRQQAETIADTLYETVSPYALLPAQGWSDTLDTEQYERLIAQENKKRREGALRAAMQKLTLEEAHRVRQYLENGLPIYYPNLSTGFVKQNEKPGKIPEDILQNVRSMLPGEISEPCKLNDGYLLYWLIEHKVPDYVELEEVKEQVWEDYISDQSFYTQEGEFERYFYSHLDEFKVPAVTVYRVELFEHKYGRPWKLVKNREKIISELEYYMFNLEYMASVARNNGLQAERRVIYMDKYHFRDNIDEKIAAAVKEGQTFGIIQEDVYEYFYALESFIPSYIPDIEDLSVADFYEVEVESSHEEEEFLEYYEKHIRDFDTPDSVSVAGVHYAVNPDTVYVSYEEQADYFTANYSRYYHEQAADLKFIVCRDQKRARLAVDFLNGGVDWELVELGFGDLSYSLKNGLHEYDKLPDNLKQTIRNQSEFTTLEPFPLEKGWLIITKSAHHDRGYYTFEEVMPQIQKKIAEYRADSLAYSRAKAVFDSTTYYADCFKYAVSEDIFETPQQDITEPYPVIGDISAHRTALLRLWRNEKLTRIVSTPDGYAVLFMRQKKYAQERSFKETLPEIKAIFAANKQLDMAQSYIEYIIKDLKKGMDGDSLLYFLGGYKRLENLGLDSRIPGFEHSRILIEDMLKHQEGYYSPVLRIDSRKFMFYHINQMRKISQDRFNRIKDEYRLKVSKQEYQKWLSDYKQRKTIRIEI